MQRLIRILKIKGWPLYVTAACLLTVSGLLLYRLGSLTTHLSQSELQQQLFSSSWHHIVDNPLYLPYTTVQWLTLTIFSHHGVAVSRLASVVYGALGLIAFTYVIRRWYGARTAVYGAVLYATSSWFLHISRLGSTEVLYLWAVPTLLAVQIAWERHSRHQWVTWLAVALLGSLLYIPGMIWLIVLSFGLHPEQLLRSWRHTRTWWHWLSIVVLVGLFMTPLLWAFIRTPTLVQTWAGLPGHYPTPGHLGHELMHTISFLGYRGPIDPVRWLDRVPVLDIFSLAMFGLGIIFYLRHAVAPRTRQLVGLWVVSAFFYALGGPVAFSVMIPVTYVVITGGIGYLLHEWLRVFPRNSIARAAGYSLLGLVVGAACTYNLRSYFVAWPHSRNTIASYQITRH